jgi:hypothetical protein
MILEIISYNTTVLWSNKHKFFERPELVYVLDEVDIALEYNPLKLVPGKRFDKSKTTQPTLTSVIGCSNALGTTLPPYYILLYLTL